MRSGPASIAGLRVILDGDGDGAWNMAVDEALLDGEGGRDGWTLRLYGWRRPTVSLGYLQRFRDVGAAGGRWKPGVDLVRRPTGGRAVLHAGELTYAIAAPTSDGPLGGGVVAAYRVIAAGLCNGLRRLGVAAEVVRRPERRDAARSGACFAARSRYELVVDGRKLVGSAQRRRSGRLVQHGSILVEPPDPRLWAVLGEDGEAAAAASVGLTEVLGERPSRRRLAAVLVEGVASTLRLRPRPGVLNVAERRGATRRAARYATEVWTRRR